MIDGSAVPGVFSVYFATHIANPKSMAFFAAVFSSAAPPHVSGGLIVALGVRQLIR